MKKDKVITIKTSEKDYERIKKNADKEGLTISAYIRSLTKGDVTKDWIKKTTVQQAISGINFILSKNEEKNKSLTDSIKKELNNLWQKL